MSISEQAFIVVLILNTLVAVIYGIWNFIQCRIREKSVKEYMIRMVIMLMCPVVGPMFFAESVVLPTTPAVNTTATTAFHAPFPFFCGTGFISGT